MLSKFYSILVCRRARLVAATLCSVLLVAPRLFAQTATVTWDPSPEPNVAGYLIHSGTTTGSYSSHYDAGNRTSLALSGLASIPSRDLDLRGTAALVSAATDARPAFELPFVVQGSWDDPIMLPDAQSLISRSNAAAPLLDAVRDRKTRDAVRSVIDRLNRDGEVVPAARQ